MTPAEREKLAKCLDRARKGDRAAFECVVRGHQTAIWHFCLSIMRDPSEADDMTQETFFRAYVSLKNLRDPERFSTWLHEIAANQCRDRLRKLKHAAAPALETATEAETWREPGRGPDEQIEQQDLARRVIGSLLPQYQTILMLREVAGLDYAELAQAMECSIDSVKARLRRARIELEKTYRKYVEET